jgi:hypothetical protein
MVTPYARNPPLSKLSLGNVRMADAYRGYISEMDYESIARHFLVPQGTEPASPPVPITPARMLRDAIEPIATIGWWSRAAADAFTSLGHGFLDGYAWGRAASLGVDVNPAVIVSAFGVFSPGLLVPVIEQARTISSRDQILDARARGASEGLAAASGPVPLATIDAAGRQLLSAMQSIEPGSRQLFGALQSLDVPANAHGRLWRAAELFREHRGDSHLAACATFDLDMAAMNVLTERWLGYPVGEYSATRGFTPEQLELACDGLRSRGWMDAAGNLTTSGQSARGEIEQRTDDGQAKVLRVLGDQIDDLFALCASVSEAVLSSHAAPADPRKRAAG